MVEIIKEKDEKKFTKAIESILAEHPEAQIHYSASQGTGFGGSANFYYTALVIIK